MNALMRTHNVDARMLSKPEQSVSMPRFSPRVCRCVGGRSTALSLVMTRHRRSRRGRISTRRRQACHRPQALLRPPARHRRRTYRPRTRSCSSVRPDIAAVCVAIMFGRYSYRPAHVSLPACDGSQRRAGGQRTAGLPHAAIRDRCPSSCAGSYRDGAHGAVCPNTLAKDDPKCQNGGRLHANNSTMEGEEYYKNCATCDCPDGWAGFDCSGETHDLEHCSDAAGMRTDLHKPWLVLLHVQVTMASCTELEHTNILLSSTIKANKGSVYPTAKVLRLITHRLTGLCPLAVCKTKDVCPLWKDPASGRSARAEACTYDAMLPTAFELNSGKRFSCECRCASWWVPASVRVVIGSAALSQCTAAAAASP